MVNVRITDRERSRDPESGPEPEKILASLDARFRARLLSMYRGESQTGTDGRQHAIDNQTLISPYEGMWLYEFCLTLKPQATVEVGMAYGYSTLYFLAALAKSGHGEHTAIDPWQVTYWHGIGLAHARAVAPAVGSGRDFHFIAERSDRAATDLARSDRSFDLIFIDGNHRFDDVLVDFYLFAPLCTSGGCIIFDDMWMPSIRTVASFVRTNRRDFEEVPSPEANVAIFRKVGEDTRQWNDFTTYPVF